MYKICGRTMYSLLNMLLDYSNFIEKMIRTKRFEKEWNENRPRRYSSFLNSKREVFISAYLNEENDRRTDSENWVKSILDIATVMTIDTSSDIFTLDCMRPGLARLNKKHNIILLDNDNDPIGPGYDFTKDYETFVTAMAIFTKRGSTKREIVLGEQLDFNTDTDHFFKFCIKNNLIYIFDNLMEEREDN